jgi:hypothetical protein
MSEATQTRRRSLDATWEAGVRQSCFERGVVTTAAFKLRKIGPASGDCRGEFSLMCGICPRFSQSFAGRPVLASGSILLAVTIAKTVAPGMFINWRSPKIANGLRSLGMLSPSSTSNRGRQKRRINNGSHKDSNLAQRQPCHNAAAAMNIGNGCTRAAASPIQPSRVVRAA